ncbi:TetR/AcrR family transcriptional regulator [Oricola cellulosilytica]|uniref:TetR/AcrR family transcriptional regulator n=1 Tax=Oricola cellulosilytica TaxID=1429082 RepID=A0A4R0P3E2_9HYPH|nr:TetR/AcrR family transcriptional regulator [Oricola cellulosilytica]TCD11372.1 TetR/AcrR family transcriptional regulator [Oricola cellulosilytica]
MVAASKEGKPYHHGDLRAALLTAAEAELIEKGVDSFSLRGTAKRAGVSHAAPAHHFRDATALLDAVAAVGFSRLADTMRGEQALAGPGKSEQFVAAGVGYVRFAIDNPEMLELMFGRSRTDGDHPDLARHAEAAFSVLVNAVGHIRGRHVFKSEEGWRDVAACWSMVHGYAQLVISGRMGFVATLEFDEQRGVIEDLMRRALPDSAFRMRDDSAVPTQSGRPSF